MKKKIGITLIVIVILIISTFLGIRHLKLKDINLNSFDVINYVKYVDEIGEDKFQLNWKNITSILAVMNNNNLSNVGENDIKEIGKKFINKDTEKLFKVEHVLEELDFSNTEKKRFYNYMNQLEYYGIVPESLSEGSEQMNFINDVKEGAIENYKKYGILPSITIGQAILESEWGRSKLATDGNNLFGIKASENYKGDVINLKTKEFYDVTINDNFRKYKTKEESIIDHGEFLKNNKRYEENGVFIAKTYINQAKALEKAGYSTAENENGEKIYAKSLIQLIREYNLQLIDSELQTEQ
ncbi:glycoside hydrolase family 73 protein [Clostridium ihumii]|uniref:glycoside hydrolase family 73 protein n=1 Tax=Clostridium ihumii TaxID=1470356 RepID=UPI00058DC487|nr:glycoside hydrolase family 73 protein [Clostridium ihumii]